MNENRLGEVEREATSDLELELLAEVKRLREFIYKHIDLDPNYPPMCDMCGEDIIKAVDACTTEDWDGVFCSRKCMIQWLWDSNGGDEASFTEDIEYYDLDDFALKQWPPVKEENSE